MSKTREEIISAMCYTFRHDYGLLKDPDNLLSAGMTVKEQRDLWSQMAQIFDNDIAQHINVMLSKEDRKHIKSELGYSRVGSDAMKRG